MFHRYRRQASSHRGFVLDPDPVPTADQNVGASLLAMGPCQATSKVNVRPPSRTGSLLQWICAGPRSSAHRRSNCRSEPARDEALSGGINVECQTAIAGKPAPTGICVAPGMADTANTCGSGLARDEAMPGNIDDESQMVIAAKRNGNAGCPSAAGSRKRAPKWSAGKRA